MVSSASRQTKPWEERQPTLVAWIDVHLPVLSGRRHRLLLMDRNDLYGAFVRDTPPPPCHLNTFLRYLRTLRIWNGHVNPCPHCSRLRVLEQLGALNQRQHLELNEKRLHVILSGK